MLRIPRNHMESYTTIWINKNVKCDSTPRCLIELKRRDAVLPDALLAPGVLRQPSSKLDKHCRDRLLSKRLLQHYPCHPAPLSSWVASPDLGL